jgi:hypothetical protein
MRLDEYRTYLDGLDLTENQIIELQETLTTIVSNIVDNLFKGANIDGNQR